MEDTLRSDPAQLKSESVIPVADVLSDFETIISRARAVRRTTTDFKKEEVRDSAVSAPAYKRMFKGDGQMDEVVA